jgi:hypothetical protein
VNQEPEEQTDDPAVAGEVVDGLPVLAPDPRVLEQTEPSGGLVPARQAAALAATGFVAGAATVAIVHRRRTTPRRAKRRKKGALGEIVASNSFLVDVHLIRRD